MPGFVLHVGATVICSHAGQAQPTVPSPSVTVAGQPIVTLPGPYVIAGCALPPPPAANGPCVTGTFITASLAVTSLGQPVLLSVGTSICAPTGTPMVAVQTQLAVSAT
jgi:hypothetical protein